MTAQMKRYHVRGMAEFITTKRGRVDKIIDAFSPEEAMLVAALFKTDPMDRTEARWLAVPLIDAIADLEETDDR